MGLSEEKEVMIATDSFNEGVAVFKRREYKKAVSLFTEIIKSHFESEYFTVLEIVGKARSYVSMAENQMDNKPDVLEKREDFIAAALIELNSGRLLEALSLLDQSLNIHGQNAKVNYTQALIYSRMGQDEKALEALQLSINTEPGLKTTAYNEPDFEKLADNSTFRSMTI